MSEVAKQIADLLCLKIEDVRVWPIMNRYNNTVRPLNCIDMREVAHKTVQDVSKQDGTWLIFVETARDLSFSKDFNFATLVTGNCEELELQKELQDKQEKKQLLPAYNSKEDVMLFFKFYDPKTSTLRYVFRLHLSMTSTLSNNTSTTKFPLNF